MRGISKRSPSTFVSPMPHSHFPIQHIRVASKAGSLHLFHLRPARTTLPASTGFPIDASIRMRMDSEYSDGNQCEMNMQRICQKEALSISDDILSNSDDTPPGIEVSESSSFFDSDSDLSYDEQVRPSKVQFSNVYIRTYAITVGDTIASKPYPLTLDWAHTRTEKMKIELFEELFCAAQTKPQKRMSRGFRKPRQFSLSTRLKRLTEVTGQAPESLHELEILRIQQAIDVSTDLCCSDDGLDDCPSRNTPYELVEMDDYHCVEV